MADRIRTRLAAIALATMVGAAPAGAASVQNGDFETPDLGSGATYSLLSPGAVPGWGTTDSAIEIWANGFNGVPSYTGTQHAEINANVNGTLFQDVAGIAAGARLDFGFAHRARQGTDVMRFDLTDLGGDGVFGTADDAVLFSDQFTATTAAWEVNGSSAFAPVTAQGGTLRLSFTPISTGSGSLSIGNFLDDVRLAPVPLPGGVPLLLGGLAALALLRRRQRAA
jgi:hypothetical protein